MSGCPTLAMAPTWNIERKLLLSPTKTTCLAEGLKYGKIRNNEWTQCDVDPNLVINFRHFPIVATADLHGGLIALHFAYTIKCLDMISDLDKPLQDFHLCALKTKITSIRCKAG